MTMHHRMSNEKSQDSSRGSAMRERRHWRRRCSVLEKANFTEWNVRTPVLSLFRQWGCGVGWMLWTVAGTLLALASGDLKGEMRKVAAAFAGNMFCSLQTAFL